MGKKGGFLEIRRKGPNYRSVDRRLKDFAPVELRLSEKDVREQAARCMDCGIPFCHGCGCPVSNVIPEWNDLVYRGRWKEALDILLSTNNFPEFTARVCPAPCESSCVLGFNDDAVTIRQIEMAIIEKGFQKGYMKPRPPRRRLGVAVAVIGSGPSGLAVADTLNRAGVNVTVYDRAEHAGGILRYGIPYYKLEKSVIDRRVDLMKSEGVEFELGVSVGDDISHNYLERKYQAVCLAGGSRAPRDLPVPGRELKGIHFAMEYLARQNRLLAGETVDGDEISACNRDVVIIGGGDTGADCLGTALRQGARRVTQLEIMPRPPEERPDDTPWPMWPRILRESSSHKEGGERKWSVSTKQFNGDNDGKVSSLSCIEVEWTQGEDGRMQFSEIQNSEFELDAQLVLLSMGFVGPGRNKLADDLGLKKDDRGNILVNEHQMTSSEGVFAAGDMARGQSLVVRAIADGRNAADQILAYFKERRVL